MSEPASRVASYLCASLSQTRANLRFELRLDGEGVSRSALSVAFFALNSRTHRPAAQASSSSSSVHGCPHACAYATRNAADCSTLAEVFGAPVAVNTAAAAPAIVASQIG